VSPFILNFTRSYDIPRIVLYAITGCVSALFCVVIISGAIRAIRHPERYGPRARFGEDGGPPQSRARGITRAILDTFPIVKFGNPPPVDPSLAARPKDLETAYSNHSMEMASIPRSSDDTPEIESQPFNPNAMVAIPDDGAKARRREGGEPSGSKGPQPLARSATFTRGESSANGPRLSQDNGASSSPKNAGTHEDEVLASIGRDKCPICIMDFEEGDDIRILPCEGNHCFHQQCVDPWLLKLSSSCPICRHGAFDLIQAPCHLLSCVFLQISSPSKICSQAIRKMTVKSQIIERRKYDHKAMQEGSLGTYVLHIIDNAGEEAMWPIRRIHICLQRLRLHCTQRCRGRYLLIYRLFQPHLAGRAAFDIIIPILV